METYYLKRHRRSAPAATTDTLKFSAEGSTHAENTVRRYLNSGIAPMDWDADFATLEDVEGKVLATWSEKLT